MKQRSGPLDDWDFASDEIDGPGERAQLRRRLAELERFRLLLDQSNDALFLAAVPSGRLADANRAASRQLGLARQKVLGQKLETFVSGASVAQIRALLADEGAVGAEGRTIVLAFVRPGGDELPVEMTVRLVALDSTVYAVVVARDISERKRSEQEIRRRTAQLEVLREAAQIMASSLDLSEILRLILDQLKRVLVYDTASVLIFREGKLPDLVAGAGYADEQMTIREAGQFLRGSPILQRMAREMQPLSSGDVRHLDGWVWVPGAEHVRSWMGIPLLVRNRMIGALMIDHARPGFYGQADLEIAQALAQHAAQAVENAHLYEEARRHNRELVLLNRIMAASTASQEIGPILDMACHELPRAFGLSQAVAFVLNEDKSAGEVVADYVSPSSQGSGSDRPFLLGLTIPVADNEELQQLLAETPLLIQDAQNDPRMAIVHDLLCGRGIVSILFLALQAGDEIEGCLVLGAGHRALLSDEDMALAQRVAGQVSSALARVRLLETQQRLGTAVEQAAEAVVITDEKANILYVNPAFERITGYRRAEVMGQSPSILQGAGMEGITHGGLWQALVSGQNWQERFDYVDKEARSHALDLTVAPVRNKAGEVTNYVATIRDVSREVQLEEQFRQSQKMEALGRLAGGVAHDFNNLLTVIRLSTQLLGRQLRTQDPLWEFVQQIGDASDHAARLTQQLLSFSRREVIKPEVLSLNIIVGNMSRMLQRIIGEDIHLETVLADELWLVNVDPWHVEQVLMNLVVNARDAMPQGGLLTIETRNVVLDEVYIADHMEAQVGEHILLAVSDTGMGMDEEVRGHLFEPFFTTKERGRGTGLGLATVFGIVKQHGGHIRVYSEPGQGTTIRIYLPRVEASPEPAANGEPAIHDLSGTETVLLVEDEGPTRRMTARILRAHGYQVLEASGGPQALHIGEEEGTAIDLLFTDVVLPGMSGKDLAQRLGILYPRMRVLYMSGHTDNVIAHHGVLQEGIAFLSKPFTLEDLLKQVRIALDHGREQDV